MRQQAGPLRICCEEKKSIQSVYNVTLAITDDSRCAIALDRLEQRSSLHGAIGVWSEIMVD